MSVESVQIYNFASGDNTYPHTGNFTVGVAGSITVDDSDGTDDAIFGDLTHTGGADEPDQNVTSSTVAGISVGDTADLRYKYTFTGSDGSSGVMHFIATNGTTNYGPLFASTIPLTPGVTYTFGTFNTDGAVAYDDLVTCFTSGTLITTAQGDRQIDGLRVGDMIQTRDNGYQPLRWIGQRRVACIGKLAPVHFAKGAVGNAAELLVSPNHRMLITSPSAQLYFGETEVLVAAKHLVGNAGITTRPGGEATYMHLLFDRHEILMGNGIPCESFFPGQQALTSLEAAARDEVLGLFPVLHDQTAIPPYVARSCLTAQETRVLRAEAA